MRLPTLPLALCLLALCVPALGPLTACGSTGPRELSKEQKLGLYLENALRYYAMDELERCIDQCQRALKLDPRNERFLLMMGKCYQLRGTTDDILTAERIFRKHPGQDDYRVRLGLGEALERKGMLFDQASRQILSGERFTEAADPEQRARELAQSSVDTWEEAYDCYQDSLELYAGGLESINGLLRVCALLGRDQESIRWSRQLMEELHASNRLYRNQLQEQDISARDEARWRESLRLNEDLEIKAILHVASLLRRLGRDREAVAELDHVIEINPAIASVHSRRAQLSYELGEFESARTAIKRYLELAAILDQGFDDPDVRRAYDLLSKAELALGNRDLRSR